MESEHRTVFGGYVLSAPKRSQAAAGGYGLGNHFVSVTHTTIAMVAAPPGKYADLGKCKA